MSHVDWKRFHNTHAERLKKDEVHTQKTLWRAHIKSFSIPRVCIFAVECTRVVSVNRRHELSPRLHTTATYCGIHSLVHTVKHLVLRTYAQTHISNELLSPMTLTYRRHACARTNTGASGSSPHSRARKCWCCGECLRGTAQQRVLWAISLIFQTLPRTITPCKRREINQDRANATWERLCATHVLECALFISIHRWTCFSLENAATFFSNYACTIVLRYARS